MVSTPAIHVIHMVYYLYTDPGDMQLHGLLLVYVPEGWKAKFTWLVDHGGHVTHEVVTSQP